MADERQVQEMVARCVGIAVFYHRSERTAKTRALMVAELLTVAGQAKGLGWNDERILGPVESELLARYGPEEARRLTAEFIRAFKDPAVPVPCPVAR